MTWDFLLDSENRDKLELDRRANERDRVREERRAQERSRIEGTIYSIYFMICFYYNSCKGDKFSYPSEPTSSRSSHNGMASNANNGVPARQYYADEKNSDRYQLFVLFVQALP